MPYSMVWLLQCSKTVKSLSVVNCAAKQLCLGGGKLDFSEIWFKHK